METTQYKNLDERIKAVWRRDLLLRLSEGGLVFLRWGLLLFLAAVLIDWLCSKWFDVPSVFRVVMLLGVLGVAFYKAWQGGWSRIRAFDAAKTALWIEKQVGGMQSLLVSAVQLKAAESSGKISSSLSELTCRKAEEAAANVKSDEVVPVEALKRPSGFAVLAVVVLLILSFTHGPILAAGLSRMFTPWLATEYPTLTHVKLAAGDQVIQEGQPVSIKAEISGVIPRHATISIRTGKGKTRNRKLNIADGSCSYDIETAFRGFEYRVLAGDDRSPWYKVEVIPAPAISVAKLRLNFPDYTKRLDETVEALTVTVPESTEITWALTLDRAVKDATFNLVGGEKMPMTISADGKTLGFTHKALASRAYSFSWVEREYGFAFKSPSYYLQVAPDRAPRVELTQPNRNLFATLGRKLDLAFRGQDDHGIAKATIAYHVDKTAEQKVELPVPADNAGREQKVDWDYRTVLPDLKIGQTLSVAIELEDHYPGTQGPHRVRSDSRRILFMSIEDYLAQVEKQKTRLLSRLRTIYREEREVYEIVMNLRTTDEVFIQTCQLEAVRQDLTRERLEKLAAGMQALYDDLKANSIEDKSLTESLLTLRNDLLKISKEHVAKAATALRDLATSGVAAGGQDHTAKKAQAAHLVNSSARELGLLVLGLGFRDATEVMARELHATAQTQAKIRINTILLTKGDAELAAEQARLRDWLLRLFKATPKGKESGVEDALIEFTLTRLVKQILRGGLDKQLQVAVDGIRSGDTTEAASMQALAIAALLKAEFRLRYGAEREALGTARKLFMTQQIAQEKLREKISKMKDTAGKHAELAAEQAALNSKMQQLLMPEVPGGRAVLFDDSHPTAPPVKALLTEGNAAMKKAATALGKGNVKEAAQAQRDAEKVFAQLTDICTGRIADLTRKVRIGRLAFISQDVDERLSRLEERQLSLLEKAEDAASSKSPSDYLVDQQNALADAIANLRLEMLDRIKHAMVPVEHPLAVPGQLQKALLLMEKAIPLLKENKAAKAAELQLAASETIVAARLLLVEHNKMISIYAATVGATDAAVVPGMYLEEIEDEQRTMLNLTKKTDKDALPELSIPQKNLIHAVNAVLTALDPIEHMVASGTVMLFAKEDMDSAATALADKDIDEAVDAQSFIIETLEKLQARIDLAIPQHLFILEVVEATHKNAQDVVTVRTAQAQQLTDAKAGVDPMLLAKKQKQLISQLDAQCKLINRISGKAYFADAMKDMTATEMLLKDGKQKEAVQKMQQLLAKMVADNEALTISMDRLNLLINPPPPEPGKKDPDEVVLLKKVLPVAAMQKMAIRDYHEKIDPEAFANRLSGYHKALGPFVEASKTHKIPVPEPKKGEEPPPPPSGPANLHLPLVAAQDALAKAIEAVKAGNRDAALKAQVLAADKLRHFVIEYARLYLSVPGPGGEQPPAPTTDFNETDDTLSLFMPGGVTGTRPPDSKAEWEVLGTRERAALNENFARELPLEYREILKDYYERLAR